MSAGPEDEGNLTADAHPQTDSPLFTTFPPEIRAQIFSFTVSAYPDTSKPYSFDSYWYRPGYVAPKRTDLAILLTCKQAYKEAKVLIWKKGNGNDEEVFWWGSRDRRPYEYREGCLSHSVYPSYLDQSAIAWQDGYWGDEEFQDEVAFGEYIIDVAADTGAGGNQENEALEAQSVAHGDQTHGRQDDPQLEEDGEGSLLADEVPLADSDLTPRERHIRNFLLGPLIDLAKGVHNVDTPLQSKRQERFTSSNWSHIRTIHIFPQMYAIKDRSFLRTFIHAEGLRPRTVKLTVRYTDWWDWENNAYLHLQSLDPDADDYYFPTSVEHFVVELESAEHKKKELEGMVKTMTGATSQWKWKRVDDEYLEFDEGVGVREWEWQGTTKFQGQEYAHHPKGNTMAYIVKVLTFSAKPCETKWDGTSFDRELAIKHYETKLASGELTE